jgi:hypothetical protein
MGRTVARPALRQARVWSFLDYESIRKELGKASI